MRGLVAVILAATASCGDGLERVTTFEPASGTRLRVMWDLFSDGSRAWRSDAFYDAELHVGCVPRTWQDASDRCVPAVDAAVYADAACIHALGRSTSMLKQTYFLAFDDGRPTALYRAGDATTTPASYYLRSGGGCVGPITTSDTATYYETTDEVAADSLVLIDEIRVGTARLAARVRTGSDGTRVPLALVDSELGRDCQVIARDDGSAACEPLDAPLADAFADAACGEPALVTPAGASAPPIAKVAAPCAEYHSVGGELAAAYRRDRGACVALLPANVRFFALGAAVEPAPVERIVETTAGRRLERAIASDPGLAIAAALVDTATHAECTRVVIDEVTRCIPADMLPALDAYAAGCQQPLRIVAVPIRACTRVAFATSNADTFAIHAIGEPFTGTAYTFASSGQCAPYTPPADVVLRTLGPPLPADTFLAAHAFGER